MTHPTTTIDRTEENPQGVEVLAYLDEKQVLKPRTWPARGKVFAEITANSIPGAQVWRPAGTLSVWFVRMP
jgi:hypothetical protein